MPDHRSSPKPALESIFAGHSASTHAVDPDWREANVISIHSCTARQLRVRNAIPSEADPNFLRRYQIPLIFLSGPGIVLVFSGDAD